MPTGEPHKYWKPGKDPERDIDDFSSYLRDILIPDLMESGFEATAEDFMRAADIIDHLRSKVP